MTKCVRDGMVAVLYSPGYGAGWSTWNDDKYRDFLLHDERLVQLTEAGQTNKIGEYVASVYPGEYVCILGAKNLKITWVSPGTRFRIEEYDGSERVEYDESGYWNVA